LSFVNYRVYHIRFESIEAALRMQMKGCSLARAQNCEGLSLCEFADWI